MAIPAEDCESDGSLSPIIQTKRSRAKQSKANLYPMNANSTVRKLKKSVLHVHEIVMPSSLRLQLGFSDSSISLRFKYGRISDTSIEQFKIKKLNIERQYQSDVSAMFGNIALNGWTDIVRFEKSSSYHGGHFFEHEDAIEQLQNRSANCELCRTLRKRKRKDRHQRKWNEKHKLEPYLQRFGDPTPNSE